MTQKTEEETQESQVTTIERLGDKIELLQILTELALREAELMWTRYSTMLYASTGLTGIVAFAVEQQSRPIRLGCAIIGLVLALVWIQMIRLSGYYYQRWQMDADHLVSSDESLKQVVRGRINPRLSPPSKWAASEYGMVIPILFATGWVLILADSVGLLSLF